MNRSQSGGVSPSAPLFDDGGKLDPITQFQRGALVLIRGHHHLGAFPVVETYTGSEGRPAETEIGYIVRNVVGLLEQKILRVRACMLEPFVEPVPVYVAGHFGGPSEGVAGRVGGLKPFDPRTVRAPKKKAKAK